MHCPCASHTSPSAAAASTNACTTVVLPIPGSPVSHTTCRAPCRTCASHCRSWANTPSRPTSSGGGARTRGDPWEGPNEPIPPPMDRPDEPRGLRGLAQRLAQLANACGQHALAHYGVRPDGLQQGLFGDQLARVCRQQAQDRKHFGGQADPLPAMPHTLVGPVHPPRLVHPTLLGRSGTCWRQILRETLEKLEPLLRIFPLAPA